MADSSDVGSLHRLTARDVFDHEAYDFTTWMEANIDSLSDVLELGLSAAEREKNVGTFSVDLVAEDGSGRRVIIENQLEETDHKHLGQVLTYLTFLDAKVAVWVTAEARPEHVSAVSWLNENASGADFYLVKVEGVQVDNSRPAPLFTRIVGPSPETRAARQTKQEWDERDRLRYEFFKGLLERVENHTSLFNSISPKPRRGISASGGPGYGFGFSISRSESRAYLYMHFERTQAVNDEAFEVFKEHREEIESKVDFDLEWVQDENRRRLIRYVEPVGYDGESQWGKAQDRLARAMAQLEGAVRPYLTRAREAAQRRIEKLEAESGAS
ncbi:DUF4268 domain-containing protein [Salinibacter ruber]|uniref:DUF4268 domain-containing protein n=1 Tax=Salinibacter ruber TaxID=146919 RepID=UPI00216784E1|nr:DUF4268 domain-containing protein [Salinibacter ruber]MCS4101256.1 hypothetical protein [Salinibacter ruber]